MHEYMIVLVRPNGRGKVDAYITQVERPDMSRRIPMDAFGFQHSIDATTDVVLGLWDADIEWVQNQPERGVAFGTFKSRRPLEEGL